MRTGKIVVLRLGFISTCYYMDCKLAKSESQNTDIINQHSIMLVVNVLI